MKLHKIVTIVMLLLMVFSDQSQASTLKIPGPPEDYESTKSIRFDRNAYGIVDVLYNTGTDKKVKLVVEHAGKRYVYDLKSEDRYVTFPLQMGNGDYCLKIYENITDAKYKHVYSSVGTLSLEDDNIIYLNSIQQIEWTNNDTAVEFAQELLDAYLLEAYSFVDENDNRTLLEGATATDMEIIDLYYNWVVENLEYDYQKIDTLESDYVPDIDLILEARGGICYDYSVLLAAMLRSQGIPSRLIKGYCSWTSVYHAWNEIWLEERGEWVIVDTTYDSYLYLRNRSYDFEKSPSVYTASYYY